MRGVADDVGVVKKEEAQPTSRSVRSHAMRHWPEEWAGVSGNRVSPGGIVVSGKWIASREDTERPASRANGDDAEQHEEQHEEQRAALDLFLSDPNHIARQKRNAASRAGRGA